VRNVKDALSSLPCGSGSAALECAYQDALSRVDEQLYGHRKIANEVFSFVVLSRRPTTVDELRYALAVNSGDIVSRRRGSCVSIESMEDGAL
jgi:hypothetical protein